jgi:hypothetical protein
VKRESLRAVDVESDLVQLMAMNCCPPSQTNVLNREENPHAMK